MKICVFSMTRVTFAHEPQRTAMIPAANSTIKRALYS